MSKADKPGHFEPDRKLRRAGKRYETLNANVPEGARAEVLAALHAGITRQHIKPGETLPELVQRVCPHVHSVALRFGFELVLDLPENTNFHLAQGRVFYVLRRVTRH